MSRVLGICFKIDLGWLELTLIWVGVSFVFILYSLKDLLVRLSVISKYSTILRLEEISILNPRLIFFEYSGRS